MLRLLTASLVLSSLLGPSAFAGQSMDLNFNLYFKAFCKNDANEVQVIDKRETITYRLELNDAGKTTAREPQLYHPLNSAGYEVYVAIEIKREKNEKNFHIRLTPWRKTGTGQDISYGTAFLEQAEPTPIANLGMAVNEEINEATGSYCTLTATIASK